MSTAPGLLEPSRMPTPQPAPSHTGLDLLRWGPIRNFFQSRYYPAVLQVPVLIIFALILGYSFVGTIRGGRNFATVVTWTLWWPLLPITLLLVGRAWCAICPFSTVAAVIQRLIHPSRQARSPLFRRYGVWLMSLTFLSLTWADRTWGITSSPRATGTVLLVLLAGAVVVSALFERRVWCRYLCPIGALTGLYAMSAFLELRAKPAICRGCKEKTCYTGNAQAEGCPLLEFPATLESNRNCNLCASCVKSCPHASLELRLRPPGREMWLLRRPLLAEAFLAVVLAVVVYVQTIDMTFAWGDYVKWIFQNTVVTNYGLIFTVSFLGAVGLGLGVYVLTAAISARLENGRLTNNFAAYGYAYLPLALAGHLGHNASHLLGEGTRAIQVAIDQLGLPLLLFVIPEGDAPPMEGLNAPALIVMILGVLGTFFVTWRIGERRGGARRLLAVTPHLVLVLVLSALFISMFLLPMNPRHSH